MQYIQILSTLTTDLRAPQARVELGEDRLDLPARGGGVQIRRLEDVDALDGRLGTQVGGPPERDGVTGDGVDVEDREADGRLGALPADEGLFRWERRAAEWDPREEVDRVRGVAEVGGEEFVGDVDVEGCEERGESCYEVVGCCAR